MLANWPERIGQQREWSWRGWQIRYSFQSSVRGKSSLPPLLLLHGFGAALEHWRHNIPDLSQATNVYALDLLGFGGSRKANTSYSAYLWSQQVYDFWRQFIGCPVVLVGNSIGSLVCLTAAYQFPEMVAGIVMLSLPDVSLRQTALPALIQPWITRLENAVAAPALLTLLFRFLRRPGVIQRWAAIAYSNPQAVTPELVQIISRPPQDEGADQAFCRLCEAVHQPGFAPPAAEILPLLTLPILLIWGQEDRMVPPSLAKGFAGLNHRIELQEWPQVGHCPQDECPERFNQTLLIWLETHF
jgi:pimeloyl-ACP methyl ester carboxylesterase